jgi:hypothetical protein
VAVTPKPSRIPPIKFHAHPSGEEDVTLSGITAATSQTYCRVGDQHMRFATRRAESRFQSGSILKNHVFPTRNHHTQGHSMYRHKKQTAVRVNLVIAPARGTLNRGDFDFPGKSWALRSSNANSSPMESQA